LENKLKLKDKLDKNDIKEIIDSVVKEKFKDI
jgi:hypothetical protein